MVLPVDPANREVVYSEPGSVPKALGEVDVVFPVLHGPYGEDGTLQGLLELSGVPYVGSGVLASAVGQDKEYMKRVFTSFGLPVGPYVVIRPREWERDESAARKKIIDFAGEHGWPLFVKPARAGSSIGITKVDDLSTASTRRSRRPSGTTRRSSWRRCCAAARSSAGSWSSRTGRAPACRPRSRRVQSHDYYDFEAKYIDSTPGLVPAPLTPEQTAEVQRLAVEAFDAASCEGLVRADFFLTEDGEFVINEINTMPGFTPDLHVPADVGGERGAATRNWWTAWCRRRCAARRGCARARSARRPRPSQSAIPSGIAFLMGPARSTRAPRPVVPLLRHGHLDVRRRAASW